MGRSVADSLERGSSLNIWGCQEAVSGPSVFVDAVDKHGVVVELSESDGKFLQTSLVVHHASLYGESEHTVFLDGLVDVEVAVMVLLESC